MDFVLNQKTQLFQTYVTQSFVETFSAQLFKPQFWLLLSGSMRKK